MKNLEITHGHSVQELVKSLTLPVRSGFDGTIRKKEEDWPQKGTKMHKRNTGKNNAGV
jgi:hypothetical protein